MTKPNSHIVSKLLIINGLYSSEKRNEIFLGCSLGSEKRLGMSFDQPAVCRNRLENIHEKYLFISKSYNEKSVR